MPKNCKLDAISVLKIGPMVSFCPYSMICCGTDGKIGCGTHDNVGCGKNGMVGRASRGMVDFGTDGMVWFIKYNFPPPI